jgi:hypothetical protein
VTERWNSADEDDPLFDQRELEFSRLEMKK